MYGVVLENPLLKSKKNKEILNDYKEVCIYILRLIVSVFISESVSAAFWAGLDETTEMEGRAAATASDKRHGNAEGGGSDGSGATLAGGALHTAQEVLLRQGR